MLLYVNSVCVLIIYQDPSIQAIFQAIALDTHSENLCSLKNWYLLRSGTGSKITFQITYLIFSLTHTQALRQAELLFG